MTAALLSKRSGVAALGRPSFNPLLPKQFPAAPVRRIAICGAAERSYSAQAALCVWGVDSIPNDPVVPCCARGGAAGRGCANALEEEFPLQWLVGVDRLRCKWLNLNFGCTTWMSLGGGLVKR